MSAECTLCGAIQPRDIPPGGTAVCVQCRQEFRVPTASEEAASHKIHKSVRKKSKVKPQEAEMDMTPMVDVTFQLLIFFMLTASFVMQRSLQIPKPEKKDASASQKSVEEMQDQTDTVVVRVDENSTYHMTAPNFDDELEIPSPTELVVKLKQARIADASGNIPSKLLVVAHGDALHERVVTAIDAGNEVGMDSVQLMTTEDDGAGL